MLPFANAQGSNLAFASEFMKNLSEAGLAKAIDNVTVATGLRSVLPTFISLFSFGTYENFAKRQKTTYGNTDYRGTSFSGASIAELIDYCAAQDLHAEIHMLLLKIDQETSRFDEVVLRSTLIPFLQQLKLVMKKHQIGYATNQYQRVFQSIIEVFLLKCVRHEPPAPPTDWKFPQKGCGCSDCLMLDRFLQRPTEAKLQYKSTIARRDHVEKPYQCYKGDFCTHT